MCPRHLDNLHFRALVRMPTPLTCGFVFASRVIEVYRVNFSVGDKTAGCTLCRGVHRHP